MIASNPYALAGWAPVRVEQPADARGVASTLTAARQADAAVVFFGGGTLQGLGNAPRRYDIAVSLRRLDRIAQYDPRELTIGLEAGVTLEGAQRALAAAGQFIPFDAPLPQRATIGGTLAAGWAGPRRATYGSLRDLLIGSTTALADGTLATAGGMVVKNVTGYDMSKLYVGSLGTLGALVRANFKALPLPAAQRVAVAPLGDDVRERALAALMHLTIEPSAALVIDGAFDRTPQIRDEQTRVIVLFEGSPAVIDRATRDLRSALGKCGVADTLLFDAGAAARILQETIDAYVEPVEDRSITYRCGGLPSTAWARSSAALDLVRASGARCDTITDLCNGDTIVRVAGASAAEAADLLDEIDAPLRAQLPAATVIAGATSLRAQIDAWGAVPPTIETLRALKARFDPSGILAPGRYVGAI
jgi:glycolate oxidase FAD binding subunit